MELPFNLFLLPQFNINNLMNVDTKMGFVCVLSENRQTGTTSIINIPINAIQLD